MLVSALIASIVLAVILSAMLFRINRRLSSVQAESDKFQSLLRKSNEHNEQLFTKFTEHRRRNIAITNWTKAMALLVREAQRPTDEQPTSTVNAILPQHRASRIIEKTDEEKTVEQQVTEAVSWPATVFEHLRQANSVNAASLWRLEKLRSERLWRAHVSVNPMTDASPFNAADDLVRLCVEVEAAALREEIGVEIEVEWNAKAIEDPARAHLIVRVAQELMATAAKTPGVSKKLVMVDDPEPAMELVVQHSDIDIDLTSTAIDPMLVESAKHEGVAVSVST